MCVCVCVCLLPEHRQGLIPILWAMLVGTLHVCQHWASFLESLQKWGFIMDHKNVVSIPKRRTISRENERALFEDEDDDDDDEQVITTFLQPPRNACLVTKKEMTYSHAVAVIFVHFEM